MNWLFGVLTLLNNNYTKQINKNFTQSEDLSWLFTDLQLRILPFLQQNHQFRTRPDFPIALNAMYATFYFVVSSAQKLWQRSTNGIPFREGFISLGGTGKGKQWVRTVLLGLFPIERHFNNLVQRKQKWAATPALIADSETSTIRAIEEIAQTYHYEKWGSIFFEDEEIFKSLKKRSISEHYIGLDNIIKYINPTSNPATSLAAMRKVPKPIPKTLGFCAYLTGAQFSPYLLTKLEEHLVGGLLRRSILVVDESYYSANDQEDFQSYQNNFKLTVDSLAYEFDLQQFLETKYQQLIDSEIQTYKYSTETRNWIIEAIKKVPVNHRLTQIIKENLFEQVAQLGFVLGIFDHPDQEEVSIEYFQKALMQIIILLPGIEKYFGQEGQLPGEKLIDLLIQDKKINSKQENDTSYSGYQIGKKYKEEFSPGWRSDQVSFAKYITTFLSDATEYAESLQYTLKSYQHKGGIRYYLEPIQQEEEQEEINFDQLDAPATPTLTTKSGDLTFNNTVHTISYTTLNQININSMPTYPKPINEFDLERIIQQRTKPIICAFSPTKFQLHDNIKHHRHNAAADTTQGVSLLCLDYDAETSLKTAQEILDKQKVQYLIYTTRNHQKEKKMPDKYDSKSGLVIPGKIKPPCDRFRVVIPLSHIAKIAPNDYRSWYLHCVDTLGLPRAGLDTGCAEIARLFWTNKNAIIFKDKQVPGKFDWRRGWVKFLEQKKNQSVEAKYTKFEFKSTLPALDRLERYCSKIPIPTTNRHNTLVLLYHRLQETFGFELQQGKLQLSAIQNQVLKIGLASGRPESELLDIFKYQHESERMKKEN